MPTVCEILGVNLKLTVQVSLDAKSYSCVFTVGDTFNG